VQCRRWFVRSLFCKKFARRVCILRSWLVWKAAPPRPLLTLSPRGVEPAKESMGESRPPAIDAASLSPALRPAAARATGAAFEVKFLLPEEKAQEVERHLAHALLPDPHSDPTLGGMYAITSLALDGPGFGVFHRDPAMKNRKYRVRRYGTAEGVFLERKRTVDRRVDKKRVDASIDDLASVANGRTEHLGHAWFVKDVADMALAPVCRVRYLRRALFGNTPEGAVRVTFDRSVRGCLAAGWSLEQRGEERVLLDGLVICEFKFHRAMPALLKNTVASMALESTGISKYRTCVRAFSAELGVALDTPAAPPPEARNA
jgi:VTC domain